MIWKANLLTSLTLKPISLTNAKLDVVWHKVKMWVPILEYVLIHYEIVYKTNLASTAPFV